MTSVLALVGSLRADSINRRIAQAAADLAPDGTTVTVADDLGALPFYNEDLDGENAPEAVLRFREQVANADALLLVTPEYNGGLPAVLKNAIDWSSRPYGNGSINGKPVAALGASMGQFGGVWAHQDSLKSAKIAGGVPQEEPAGSFSTGALDSPADDEQVRDVVRAALATLAREVQETTAA